MGIFNYDEFNKKEKPVFTGSKFGFGAATGGGPLPFQASGGTKQTGVSTPDGTFTIHTFLSSGQFEIQTADPAKQLDILIVGGGAPGDIPHGGQIQGGAGGGGVVLIKNRAGLCQEAIQYTMTVGNPKDNARSHTGASSSAFGLTVASGGGGGGQSNSAADGQAFGSGGGGDGGSQQTAVGDAGAANFSPLQGSGGTTQSFRNAGGKGEGQGSANHFGGGGGGAGGAGSDAQYTNPQGQQWGKGGDGGPGYPINFDGTEYYYGAGGGGSIYVGQAGSNRPGSGVGAGGRGGGGGGGIASPTNYAPYFPSGNDQNARNAGQSGGHGTGGDAGANTGAGGGGKPGYTSPGEGGFGGSGIIQVRYTE